MKTILSPWVLIEAVVVLIGIAGCLLETSLSLNDFSFLIDMALLAYFFITNRGIQHHCSHRAVASDVEATPEMAAQSI